MLALKKVFFKDMRWWFGVGNGGWLEGGGGRTHHIYNTKVQLNIVGVVSNCECAPLEWVLLVRVLMCVCVVDLYLYFIYDE